MSTPPAERLFQPDDSRSNPEPYVLDRADLASVAHAVAAITADWTVELSQVFADEANLIIMPEHGDDDTGPTFVIYHDDGMFCVDQVHWDSCTPIGHFHSLATATQAMVLHLAYYAGGYPAGSCLLH